MRCGATISSLGQGFCFLSASSSPLLGRYVFGVMDAEQGENGASVFDEGEHAIRLQSVPSLNRSHGKHHGEEEAFRALESVVDDLREEVKSLQESNNRLESQLLELEEALKESEKEKELLLQREKSLSSEKEELLKVKVNNGRLIKELQEEKEESLRKVSQLEAENKELSARNSEINEEFSLRSKKLKEQLEESLRSKEELEAKINDLTKRISGLEYDVGESNSELKMKDEAISALEREKEVLEMHLHSAESELGKTKEDSAAGSKKVIEMKYEIERLQVQSARLSQVVAENSRLDSENGTLKEEINEKDNLLEKAEREIQDLREKLGYVNEDKEEALEKALKQAKDAANSSKTISERSLPEDKDTTSDSRSACPNSDGEEILRLKERVKFLESELSNSKDSLFEKENESKRLGSQRYMNTTTMLVSAGTVAAAAFLCHKFKKFS
eukprot:TRINITY_DN1141_c0_g1_i2.p1 TRINITY_DN1141_c0_g1~~TRINITY_DN1141_c0_g1_i2.p1  ORF type:complete len:445 (-),score=123.54 TRINITY_DN1141_c0_g1_i2:171-1505(-)